jgi:hypothetical protein
VVVEVIHLGGEEAGWPGVQERLTHHDPERACTSSGSEVKQLGVYSNKMFKKALDE